jgi:hypothetical protein
MTAPAAAVRSSTVRKSLKRVCEMNARQAWTLLAAGVLSYEMTCKDGQLLSECVDEWLVSKPILTRAAIAAVALHLGNAVPKRYDVVSLGCTAIRRSSRYWATIKAAS